MCILVACLQYIFYKIFCKHIVFSGVRGESINKLMIIIITIIVVALVSRAIHKSLHSAG